MNHNYCDIPHVNTIDMMVHAYVVVALNITLCIEVNFLHATT
jgi:hypothetical protein